MTLARRRDLGQLEQQVDHAGLALERYLTQHDDQHKAAQELIAQISELEPGTAQYELAFERWKAALQGSLLWSVTAQSSLAVGLGNATPLENGLSIHKTYGTPFLPGSALKGLAKRVAMAQNWPAEAMAVLFGEAPTGKTPDADGFGGGSAGQIVFWDAWFDPEGAQKTPFQRDTTTVHHQKYYGGGDQQPWPTDFDDPNPVAWLSVQPGTRFCMAISSIPAGDEMQDWRYLAAELLNYGLTQRGLGGKTNAGYGFFDVEQLKRPKTEAEAAKELLAQYQGQIEKIKGPGELTKIDQILREIAENSAGVQRPTLLFIKEKLKAMKQWDISKGRCQKIAQLLGE
jgi:CRISPR-associated protein Cmr6